MKLNVLKCSRNLTVLALAAFLGAFAADAADPAPGAPPARGQGGGAGNGGGGANRPGRGGFGLDETQRAAWQEATQKQSDELAKLEEKLRAAQKELMHAALAEKQDEKAVREKAETVAKIQVDISVLRAKALAVVGPTLKAEQRDQLESSRFGIMMLSTSCSATSALM